VRQNLPDSARLPIQIRTKVPDEHAAIPDIILILIFGGGTVSVGRGY
jgi:hypothetical protein